MLHCVTLGDVWCWNWKPQIPVRICHASISVVLDILKQFLMPVLTIKDDLHAKWMETRGVLVEAWNLEASSSIPAKAIVFFSLLNPSIFRVEKITQARKSVRRRFIINTHGVTFQKTAFFMKSDDWENEVTCVGRTPSARSGTEAPDTDFE
jgi:hypothetical protein